MIAFETEITCVDTDETLDIGLAGKLGEAIILKIVEIDLAYPGLPLGVLKRAAELFATLFQDTADAAILGFHYLPIIAR
jgi:hypothetical protein